MDAQDCETCLLTTCVVLLLASLVIVTVARMFVTIYSSCLLYPQVEALLNVQSLIIGFLFIC